MDDAYYMKRALALAEHGLGSTSPNPMVGCVVVYKDCIIGEGYTSPYGGPHAEVNAIQAVKDHALLSKSTLFVTLEPCAHYGKTPPCADLIVAKKVKKVVIACRDPFDEVDGKGIERMRNAGIEVEVGMLETEAKELNRRFFTSIEKKRPYILLKWAQTADGFIARENYDSKWISNKYSRQLVHKWRTEEDAILVGKNTAIRDDPSLTARDWAGNNPVRVLLDSHLEVKENSQLFDHKAPTVVLNVLKEKKEGNIQWIKLGINNPRHILEKLHDRKIASVIIEGGAQVLNAFIQNNYWDEARVFTSENTFGKGISAPKLYRDIQSKETIFGDQLTIYRNING